MLRRPIGLGGDETADIYVDQTLTDDTGEAARKVVMRRASLVGMVQAYQGIYADLIRKPEHAEVRK